MSKKTFPDPEFSETALLHLSGCTYDFYKPRAADLEHYAFEPTLTRQEFAEDADINTIMARYEVTGQLPAGASMPHYADYTGVPDLMGAMEVFNTAQSEFMRLPAKVRREFDNDPMIFVEFAGDPKNLDQMRAWGLAPPAPAERPPVADLPLTELKAGEFADLVRGPPKPA